MRMFKVAALPLLALPLSSLVQADPPGWAPAHGKRGKEAQYDSPVRDMAPRYRGYTGVGYSTDYGVSSGRCNTDAVLAAAGAVGGAYVGNRVGDSGNKVLTTVIGAVAGGLLGRAIGEAIDDRDRACIGHALELAPAGQVVRWQNPATRTVYVMTPVRDLDGGCREFELRDERNAQQRAERVRACRNRDGGWEIQR